MVHPNLGLCLVLTLKDEISLTQPVYNWTNNHWVSQPFQFLNRLQSQPMLDHLYLYQSLLNFIENGFVIYFIEYRFFPHKRDSTQELNLTLLSKIIISFSSTIQKRVTLIERVETKRQISNAKIQHKVLQFQNASTCSSQT